MRILIIHMFAQSWHFIDVLRATNLSRAALCHSVSSRAICVIDAGIWRKYNSLSDDPLTLLPVLFERRCHDALAPHVLMDNAPNAPPCRDPRGPEARVARCHACHRRQARARHL